MVSKPVALQTRPPSLQNRSSVLYGLPTETENFLLVSVGYLRPKGFSSALPALMGSEIHAGGLYLGGRNKKKVFIHICTYSKISFICRRQKTLLCFSSKAIELFFFMASHPKVLYKTPPHHCKCHLLQHSYRNRDSHQVHRGVPSTASSNPHCAAFNKQTGAPRIGVACPASHR